MHRWLAGFLWVGLIWVLSFFSLSQMWVAVGTGAIFLAGLGSGPGVEEASGWRFLFAVKVHGVVLAFLFISVGVSNLELDFWGSCPVFEWIG